MGEQVAAGIIKRNKAHKTLSVFTLAGVKVLITVP